MRLVEDHHVVLGENPASGSYVHAVEMCVDNDDIGDSRTNTCPLREAFVAGIAASGTGAFINCR